MLASAGDVPTLEALAAAQWLREHLPDLRVRFVNIVDLMPLFPTEAHPHGMNGKQFRDLFTSAKPVIFAFHGYQRAIHEIIHGRENAERFHVRGFNEQGNTTTPFLMVVLNGMSPHYLASEAIKRMRRTFPQGPALLMELDASIKRAVAHAHKHLEDDPDITNWTWQAKG